jgi:hypothetical protein
MKKKFKDYSKMTIFSIIKMALEKYTGLPAKENTHIQITLMWRATEAMVQGETELYNGTRIKYDSKDDENKNKLLELCFLILTKYDKFLTFKDKANTDSNKFKIVKANIKKINKRDGKDN